MKAFPAYEYQQAYDQMMAVGGMELRDYFAAKAMQAIITRCDEKSSEIEHIDSWIGSYAYVVADAMMQTRKEEIK
jgi:hypothetical protein